MEFYNFLKENNITSFEVLKNIVEKEPYFLKVKEDNMLPELALIHNTNESDFNLNIVISFFELTGWISDSDLELNFSTKFVNDRLNSQKYLIFKI